MSVFDSDDFSGTSLDDLWLFEGPAGSASVSNDGQDAYLELVVPSGGPYDAWGANNAARVMQSSTNEDFGIEAKFLSTPSGPSTEVQGLMVEQDAQNWIRFDTFAYNGGVGLFSAVTVNGVTSMQLFDTAAAGDAAYLRVTRAGDSWTFEYSADGQSWNSAGSFNHSLVVSEVGVFAATTTSSGYTAQVDYFFNTAAPIVPEDAGATTPVAVDDTLAASAGAELIINVANDLLANDSDPNGDPLSLVGFTQPANGAVVDNGDGTLTYTPNAGFVGTDTLTYTISDGTNTATATVTVTVADPGNEAPVALADTATIDEDDSATIAVLANDSDPNADPLQISAISNPLHGTAVLNDGGTPGDPSDDTIVYTPNPNFAGQDSFSYTVSDGRGGSATANVTVTVDPVNDAPVAAADSYTAFAGMPLTVTGPGVLANDTDADGDALSATLVTDVSHGTLVLNGNGSFTYTPTAGYIGPDSFTYAAGDGAASDTATVALNVANLPGGFTSDDFTGASLGADWSFQGPAGSASVASDGQDAYLALVVPDGPTYDAWGANNTAIRVMRAATNGDFGVEAKFLTTPSQGYEIQGILVEQDSQNWIRFDTYHDGSSLRIFSAVTVNGSTSYKIDQAVAPDSADYLRVTHTGNTWTYQYSADGQNWSTAVSFNQALTVTAIGPFAGSGGAAPGYTSLVDYFFNTAAPISPEDAIPPVAQDDLAATSAGTALILDVANDLLANDSDPNGDPLSLAGFAQPAHGALADNGDGTLTYTPNAGFTGVDTFTYMVSDGTGVGASSATVRIAVDNAAPAPQADTAVTEEHTPVVISVLSNDGDPDGDAISISSVTDPTNGTVAVNGDGTITYTPNLGFFGSDAFTYSVSDGVAETTATVDVTVNEINDPPVAANDSVFTQPGTPLVITVASDLLNNDSDPEGDSLTLSGFTQPSHGTLIDNGDGTLVYVPQGGYRGPDSFTYTATDGTNVSNAATVAVQVGLPGAFQSDPFSSATLDSAWSLQGPAGSVNLANNGEDAYLEIVVPDGGVYDAWGANNTAARVMRSAANEDFGVEAKFLTAPSQAYEIQGILVQQDSQNWIRFDTYHDGNSLRVLSAVTVNGVTSSRVDQAVGPDSAEFLRVTHTGNSWTYEYSADGQNWTTAVSFNQALTVTSIGPFAGSAGDAPGYTAQVDYFFNTAAPIVPDDVLPPVAQDDLAATSVNTALVLNVANDLLANDSDPNGDPLSLAGFTQPTHGALVDNGNGTLTYTPNAGFTGVDSFNYTIDAGPDSATATVRIGVDNAAPVAQADSATTNEDTSVVISVLANDSDPNGDPIKISAFTDPANGSVTLGANNTLIYTPDPDYNGTDSFIYTVTDGIATTTAAVQLTVNPINDPPMAQDDAYITKPDTPLILNVLNDLLGNDFDAEGDPLTVVNFGTPSHGTLFDNGDGTLTYTPNAGYNGDDTFTYTISDGNAIDTATVQVTMTDVIDVWGGTHQAFGDPGEAQRWINILGNVDASQVESLSYSLNGGADRELSIGPDMRRLQSSGDFNIDIDYKELNGTSVDDIVTIKAMLYTGQVVSANVTVDYESGHLWPTNYSIDWSTVTDIRDVVQVIDGQWEIDDNGLHPVTQGYDRVFAIGDKSWDNYEINLQITMNDLHTVDPAGHAGGGFGPTPFWNGHTDDPVPDAQPKEGWEPSTAFWYFTPSSVPFFTLDSHFVNGQVIDSAPYTLQEGVTYNFTYRIEQTNVFDRTYSMKVWAVGEEEPTDWLLQGTEIMPEPVTGAFLFNSHYYDVSFGDITVTEITGSDIVFADEYHNVLMAVDTGQSLPGLGEIDVLTGHDGADTFVLGDATGTFYDDGDSGTSGQNDYALVRDFQSGTDTIELGDVMDNFVLSDAPAGMPAGTAISHVNPGGGPNELVGIVSGVFNMSLNGGDFLFHDPLNQDPPPVA